MGSMAMFNSYVSHDQRVLYQCEGQHLDWLGNLSRWGSDLPGRALVEEHYQDEGKVRNIV